MSKDQLIVQLYFENPIVSAGGLGTVTNFLPKACIQGGEKVISITPFHHANATLVAAHRAGRFAVHSVGKTFKTGSFSGKYTSFIDKENPSPWIYLACDGCFAARENPYAYKNKAYLLKDAVIFSAAAVQCVVDMQDVSSIVFHAHDWETALVSIFASYAKERGRLLSYGSLLTLHNSFDCGLPLSYRKFYFDTEIKNDTVLSAALPYFTGPLSTVSKTFAKELASDPLQHSVFIPHLKDVFAKAEIVGIPHGSFSEVPAGRYSLNSKDSEQHAVVKQCATVTALELIVGKNDSRIIGSFSETDRNVPLFFMAGRFDLMQKGYETIFAALKMLPADSFRMVFCPSSGFDATQDPQCNYFVESVNQLAGSIVIWPFRISRREYMTLLAGAHFMLMPSYFEPYGSVSEAFSVGTPVCARSCGGLLDQIVFLDNNATGKASLKNVKNKYVNGVLYREEFNDTQALSAWRELLFMPLQKRIELPLCKAIITSAHKALQMCCNVFSDSNIYFNYVYGALMSENQNTWEKAAQEYSLLYNKALAHK